MIRLYLLIALSCALPLSAQPMSLQQINAEINRAGECETRGDFDCAQRIYRQIYAQYPGRGDVLMRLTQVLSRTGQHAEVADLLRQHLTRVPGDITTRLRLGETLFALGLPDSAAAQWDRIAEGATHATLYALVADAYRRRNLDDQAAHTYRRARKTLNSPDLFAQELAEIAEGQARYAEAAQEYLTMLQQRPQYRTMIEARFREFAITGNQHDAVLTLLSDQIRAHPDDPTYLSLLIAYALPAGFSATALPLFLGMPTWPDNTWPYVFQLAQHALQTDDPENAAKAYEALHTRVQRPDVRARALLGLSHAYRALGQAEQARTHYQQLIATHPLRSETDEARYHLSLLQRDDQPEVAQATLRELIAANRQTSWRYRAMFALSEGHIRAGQFDQAEHMLFTILSERENGQEASRARFQLAELQFLTGRLEPAQSLLNALMATDRTQDVVNDAIELSALIQEGQHEQPDLLQTYADILLKYRQNQNAAALLALQRLLDNQPESFLTDRALYLQAELHEKVGQFTQAIQTHRKLITGLPWSPLCPGAQLAMARIYEKHLSQYYEAKRAYETLLIDHPISLEADQARERLRALQYKIRELEKKRETG